MLCDEGSGYSSSVTTEISIPILSLLNVYSITQSTLSNCSLCIHKLFKTWIWSNRLRVYTLTSGPAKALHQLVRPNLTLRTIQVNAWAPIILPLLISFFYQLYYSVISLTGLKSHCHSIYYLTFCTTNILYAYCVGGQ